MFEIAAAVVAAAGDCLTQRTVALAADYVGSFEDQVVDFAGGLSASGCQKDLKIVGPVHVLMSLD